MKRLLGLIFLFSLIVLPVSAVEPTGPQEQQQVAPKYSETVNPGLFWEDMSDLQMALVMINRQFDYLLNRVEESDTRLAKFEAGFEEKLVREREKADKLRGEYEGTIKSKEMQITELHSKINELEKKNALFNSQSGIYLKIVLAFLAGLICGQIYSAINGFWQRHKYKDLSQG